MEDYRASFYKVFRSCSCVFLLLDLSPIVSLWIPLCALFYLADGALFTFLGRPIFMF